VLAASVIRGIDLMTEAGNTEMLYFCVKMASNSSIAFGLKRGIPAYVVYLKAQLFVDWFFNRPMHSKHELLFVEAYKCFST
jgi:hypothetical protein